MTDTGPPPNRVKRLYSAGSLAIGTYLTLPTPATVEIAAVAGFDFVRIDAYHSALNPETVQAMVTAAYSYGVTPWVRCRNDAFTIMNALDLGAQMLTIPNVESAESAQAAVRSAYFPPEGTREMARPIRFRGYSMSDYVDWVRTNVVISCQIEGVEGLANYMAIVRVEGLGCIQTGRGDIALALGLDGDEDHPRVLEAEERIVEAALEAGKQVSLVHPLTEAGLARALAWSERGVRILTLDADSRVLLRGYSEAVLGIRGSVD